MNYFAMESISSKRKLLSLSSWLRLLWNKLNFCKKHSKEKFVVKITILPLPSKLWPFCPSQANCVKITLLPPLPLFLCSFPPFGLVATPHPRALASCCPLVASRASVSRLLSKPRIITFRSPGIGPACEFELTIQSAIDSDLLGQHLDMVLAELAPPRPFSRLQCPLVSQPHSAELLNTWCPLVRRLAR